MLSSVRKKHHANLVFALIALAVPMQAHGGQPKVNHIVQVEGRTYRVMVNGEEVRVFDKAITWAKSLKQRDRMRQAVTLATGCQLTDDYWAEGAAHLTGLLDCSKQ